MNEFNSYTPRPHYIEKVSPYIGQQLIKVLTGQRRVGKSVILRQIAEEIRRRHPACNVIVVDKEQLSMASIVDEFSLWEYVNAHLQSGTENCLFIDEVQEIANFQQCLRDLLNENKCDIYCTGSNAKILSGELATLLSGRYLEINVHPLSYGEYLRFRDTEPSDKMLRDYLTLGGMPYAARLPQENGIVMEYLRNVYASILLKDVVARESIRNIAFIENLVKYIADNTGSLFSALNISRYLKSQRINISTQTTLNYLRALCNSFIVRKANRSDVCGLKIFEIGEKYYFEDLGLRNVIVGANIAADMGKLVENAVYIDLVRNGFNVHVGQIGTTNKEVDFVAERNGERIYVQAAYMIYDQSTKQREVGSLLQINDNHPKYVVTLDPYSTGTDAAGIRFVHLSDFLLAPDKFRI